MANVGTKDHEKTTPRDKREEYQGSPILGALYGTYVSHTIPISLGIRNSMGNLPNKGVPEKSN